MAILLDRKVSTLPHLKLLARLTFAPMEIRDLHDNGMPKPSPIHSGTINVQTFSRTIAPTLEDLKGLRIVDEYLKK